MAEPMEPNPTAEQLAASIGCEPERIIRSVRSKASGTWISFVEDTDNPGGPALVFETVWPQ